MDSNSDNDIYMIHKLVGTQVESTIRFEIDNESDQVLSVTMIDPKSLGLKLTMDENGNPKLEDDEEDEGDDYLCVWIEGPAAIELPEKLDYPVMTRCQNCDVNFATKYQYQRHQCDFKPEKAVLKTPVKAEPKENKYECDKCHKQFVLAKNYERHVAAHENDNEYICGNCDKRFVNENRLRIHRDNHCKKADILPKFYRSDMTVWQCGHCHELFSSPVIADLHLTVCKRDNDRATDTAPPGEAVVPVVADVQKILTEILLQCQYCNRTYSDKSVLMRHQSTHTTDKNYECKSCGAVFDSYVAAAQHWLRPCVETANVFYLARMICCEKCERTFKSHELLYIHKVKQKHFVPKIHVDKGSDDLVKVKEEPPSSDEEQASPPGEEVALPDGVTVKKEPGVKEEPKKKKRGRKKKVTRGPKKSQCPEAANGFGYQCEKCGKVFKSVQLMDMHREKEHNDNVTCQECGEVLTSAAALTIHSRIHKKLKPYICDTCGRSYSQTSHLWQHMRFHQGIKPFACPYENCEARYTIRPDLKDHIRKVHTRERPFKCNVCNKSFLTGSVFYQHRLIHTNDRRYGCDVCEKRFFRADALNNHKRIHTDEKPYVCTACGKAFRQKGDRNKHFRTQHG